MNNTVEHKMEKQLKALASELRKHGCRGKVDGSSYVAPKTVEAPMLERYLQRAGWKCIKPGMYYTEMSSYEQIGRHHGVYEKDGLRAKVSWYSTSSTLPPAINLEEMQPA